MNLKKSILEYLQSRDLYHESDDILLDELIFNIKIAKEAKDDIATNGLQTNITLDPTKQPYWVKNQSINTYQQCLKNIQSLFRQLGLSPNERQKLKIELAAKKDEFDSIFEDD
jgi:P27 family predicted phage terminase small subunit